MLDPKKEIKIKKLLGDRFHLCIEYNPNCWSFEWYLYRNYKDPMVYFSQDNELIMSSKTNTEDELYEYAKKHHIIDYYVAFKNLCSIFLPILLILAFLNLTLLNNFFIALTIMIVQLLILEFTIFFHLIYEHNFKVKKLESFEYFSKNISERYKKIKEKYK